MIKSPIRVFFRPLLQRLFYTFGLTVSPPLYGHSYKVLLLRVFCDAANENIVT